MAWTPFNRTPPSLLLLTLLSWTGHVSSKTTRRGDISISMAYSNLDTTTFCSNLTIGEPDSCEDALIVPMYPNHQVPEGSLISPQKMWYARRLDDGVYISGQPTPRQIKYAADSGFKTVVSVFTHKGQLSPDGKEVLMSTATEKFIVESLAGMKFFTVLDGDQDGDWNSVGAVRKMTEIFRQLELPALIHCRKGVVSTFLALLYYANQTVNDPDFKPRVNSTRFYEITRKHGLDFVKLLNYTSATVASITGEALPKTARAPKVSLAQWYTYWASRPLYENWYTAGQINANDLYVIKTTGFNQIVNLRKGTTHGGRPSQEEVQLINIRSKTPTYGTTTLPPRQSKRGLQMNVLDPSKAKAYVSESSKLNYETMNSEEFGDDIGYNETEERRRVKEAGIQYFHFPLDQLTEFGEFFKKNKDTLLEIGKNGPVLVHCAIGLRAATVAVLTAALQYNLTFEWAVQRLKEMGFGISADSFPNVYNVYKEYLLTDERVEL